MIDLHTHILPGVDDGVESLDEALDVIRRLSVDGVRTIAATPHVREDYPTTPKAMETSLDSLTAASAAAGLDVVLRGGAEIALDRIRMLSDDELARFGLGGNAEVLLLEFPYFGWPLELDFVCARLRRLGIVPVLAHPERNGEVQARPRRLERVVAAGGLVQLTSASLVGGFGPRARATAFRLLQLELAHLLATDSHGSRRDVLLSNAAEEVGDETLAAWLVDAVPAALVGGEPIPQRPQGVPRGWLERLVPSSWRRAGHKPHGD